MRTKMVRRGDRDGLEQRRMRAAVLFAKGWSQAAVAKQFGVSRESARRWANDFAAGGRDALHKAARTGRPNRLGEAQIDHLTAILEEGPLAAGFPTDLWTCERVAMVVEREFGIAYHPGHVGKLLRRMGWSCQRPVGRAAERDEEAIARWKRVEWPRIKKKPLGKHEPSSSSMKAASRNDRTVSAPGRHAARRRSSNIASPGKRSRPSRA